MKLLLTVSLFAFAAASASGADAQFTPVENGVSDWHIVVPKGAIPSEHHAGRELQYFLQRISGAELPIVESTWMNQLPEHGHEIVVGWCWAVGANPRIDELLKKHNVKIDFQQLGDDGFVIRTIGPHLLIAGGRPRGTLYGVYTFLEEVLGCRWYDSQVSVVPKSATIRFGPLNIRQVPRIRYREISYGRIYCADPDLAVRNKVNGDQSPLEPSHGGTFGWANPAGHTFGFLVPTKTYLEEHPEYYALRDGKRTAAQLCLTNPDVLRITIERVRQWMKDNPDKLIFDVSQNDNGSYCQCPECAALDKKHGSPQGSLLTFVNKVADGVRDDFPKKYVATFAYAYSERAPEGLKPRPNVVIRLCTFCCSSIFNYEREGYCGSEYFEWMHGGERPTPTFGSNAKKWSELTKNIVLWDYAGPLCHALAPCPNLTMLQPNIKFLADLGIIGFYPQGSYRGLSGGLNVLRSYLLAKLAWNPDFDVDRGINEFLAAYYGRAAGPIRKYIDIVHANVPKHDTEMRPFDAPFEINWFHCSPTRWWLKPELLARYDALFDEAERLVADSPNVLRRVQRARLSVQYVQIRTLPKDNPERAELIDRFFKVIDREGIIDIGHAIIPRVETGSKFLTIYGHVMPSDFRAFLENGGQ